MRENGEPWQFLEVTDVGDGPERGFHRRARGTKMMKDETRDRDIQKLSTEFDDQWLSVRESARHARVSEKTIRRAYLSRQIRHTRIGRAVRFRRTWIDEWMLKAEVVTVA
jgi:excisionase family DNA binding protein